MQKLLSIGHTYHTKDQDQDPIPNVPTPILFSCQMPWFLSTPLVLSPGCPGDWSFPYMELPLYRWMVFVMENL